MLAIVKTSRQYGGVEVKEAEKPKIKTAEQVLVKVKSAAICGSDIHAYEYPPSYEFIEVPVILGHEFCGIVEEAGVSVKGFKPGDIVMGESNKYCRTCENCRQGKTNICYNSKMTGLHVDGVMAEYVAIDEHLLHHVPNNLSYSEGAVAQAATVSVHGLEKTTVKPGDTVLVFGPGIVGQAAAQLVRLKGASKVFIIGTAADEGLRLPMARALGFATIVIDKESIPAALQKCGLPDKVDTVVECTGVAAAFLEGINHLKKGGQLTILGIYNKPFEIPMTQLVRNEIVLNTSYTSSWYDYEKTLQLLSLGDLKLKELCKEYPIEEGVQAFEDAVAKKVTKPVIVFP